MPIGKNSIKRVANNGYSAVKTSAPDMENSTELKTEPERIETAVPAEPTPAKAPELVAYELIEEKMKPRSPRAKSATKKKASKKQAEESTATSTYVNIGRDMPTYLL